MSVLSDRDIKDQIAAGRILIEPLDRDAIQPASVDLCLDSAFRVFNVTARPYVDVREPVDDLTRLVTISPEDPFIVQPGVFCLATTLETITLPDDIVARVDGRSSLGRLGLLVHAIIQAPAVLTADTEGKKNVVEVRPPSSGPSPTVTMSGFTVAGPGPSTGRTALRASDRSIRVRPAPPLLAYPMTKCKNPFFCLTSW